MQRQRAAPGAGGTGWLATLGCAGALLGCACAASATESPAPLPASLPPVSAPPASPPPTGLARWFDPTTAPFLPIPEIDTAPHSGLTLGVIPTVLHDNERGEIDRILAPDLIHSQYFGWGSRMRIFGYPSADTQWSVVGGLKQRVEREFDAVFATGQARMDRYTWLIEAIYDRSGTARYFGLGNDSRHAAQTSYVDNQGRFEATLGLNLTHAWQLSYGTRWRTVSVLPGVLAGLPSIEAKFPGLEGIGSEHELRHQLAVVRDTRDSGVIPRRGARYVLYGNVVSRALGSSASYTAVGAEGRQYWPVGRDLTLAWHAALRYMPSAREAPFWALSSLGGDRSVLAEREPLRAYGADRYIDRNLFSSGVELRTRVAGVEAFATHLSIEIAPFVDVGKVFAGAGESPLSHLHKGAGIGIRGVASPFVVGYLDIGYGHDKAAVFSGLNYPF